MHARDQAQGMAQANHEESVHTKQLLSMAQSASETARACMLEVEREHHQASCRSAAVLLVTNAVATGIRHVCGSIVGAAFQQREESLVSDLHETKAELRVARGRVTSLSESVQTAQRAADGHLATVTELQTNAVMAQHRYEATERCAHEAALRAKDAASAAASAAAAAADEAVEQHLINIAELDQTVLARDRSVGTLRAEVHCLHQNLAETLANRAWLEEENTRRVERLSADQVRILRQRHACYCMRVSVCLCLCVARGG